MKRILALVALCATVSLAFAHCNNIAENIPDSTQHIREVVVKSRAAFNETAPSQTLQGAQLERLGNQNVADALRFFSGIQVNDCDSYCFTLEKTMEALGA